MLAEPALDGPTRGLVAHIDETLHALAYGCQHLYLFSIKGERRHVNKALSEHVWED